MIPATVIISFFLLGIEELGIQLEEPFRYVPAAKLFLPSAGKLESHCSALLRHIISLLPQHKITNGIGLSAEEHVEWMLKDDINYREGRVNAVNAALGGPVQQLVDQYMYNSTLAPSP